jgi:hypothetical protein
MEIGSFTGSVLCIRIGGALSHLAARDQDSDHARDAVRALFDVWALDAVHKTVTRPMPLIVLAWAIVTNFKVGGGV